MRRLLGLPAVAAAMFVIVAAAASCDRGGGEVSRASAESPSAEGSDPGDRAVPSDRDGRYRTEVRPEQLTAGEGQDVELSVVPAEGLKVNREYPKWELTLEPPEGLDLEETSFSAEDFELGDSGAIVSTTLSAAESGSYEIPGTAGFSVCNDETCHIMRDERLSFRVNVSSTTRDDPRADDTPQR